MALKLLNFGKDLGIELSPEKMHEATAESQQRGISIEKVIEEWIVDIVLKNKDDIDKALAEAKERGITVDDFIKEKESETEINSKPKLTLVK